MYKELVHLIERAELNFKSLMSREDRRSDNSYKTVISIKNKLNSFLPDDCFTNVKFTRTEVRIMQALIDTTKTALLHHTIPTYKNRIEGCDGTQFPQVLTKYETYLNECTKRVKVLEQLMTYLEGKL